MNLAKHTSLHSAAIIADHFFGTRKLLAHLNLPWNGFVLDTRCVYMAMS
jgi:hypothetical protein